MATARKVKAKGFRGCGGSGVFEGLKVLRVLGVLQVLAD